MMENDEEPAGLRWLFIDLNSFFASVEQQHHKGWRDRPLIVRPAPSEHTCAIAASHEAKAFGVRTGTRVSEARQLCAARGETLIVAEARPDLYVEVHHKIMAEIDRHVPIHKVGSIDEASCRLTGRHCRETEAVALARRIQQGIKARLGLCLRSSVGLAPSRFLAKTACGMKKPDGLTVLRLNELPQAIAHLPLSSYPGIGPRMRQRLEAAGITDTVSLWNTDARQARALWNSIEGERIWRGLHGLDSAEPIAKPPASISHSHVLAQAMRTPQGARAVARRLVVKCGARLRRMGLTGATLTLHLDMGPRGARRDWETASLHVPVRPTQDTFALLKALDGLWGRVEPEIVSGRLSYVGVGVHGLHPVDQAHRDLFDPGPDHGGQAPSLRLAQALDQLNRKFGKDTVSIGPRANLPDYIGAKIAFNRIPDPEDFWE